MVTISAICSIISAVLVVSATSLVRISFNQLTQEETSISSWIYLLSVVGMFIFGSVITLFARWQILVSIKQHIKNLRTDLCATFLKMPRAHFLQIPIDKAQLVIVTETERQDRMLNGIFGVLIPSTILSITLLFALLYYSFALFLCAAISLIIILLLQKSLTKLLTKRTIVFQRSYDQLFKGIMFIGRNLELIHTHSTVKKEKENQEDKIETLYHASVKFVKASTLFQFIVENLLFTLVILLISVGSFLVNSGTISVGDLASSFLIIWLLRTQLTKVTAVIPIIIEGKESLQKISAFKQHPPPVYLGTDHVIPKGSLIMKNIDFSYGNQQLFQNLNFSCSPGKCTALIGDNGSGKSTIIHLILGFYSPKGGNICMDGYDYQSIDFVHLRRHIGVVQQHPLLIDASIKSNLIYGTSSCSDQDIQLAINRAGISNFIMQLEEGIETQIGSNGIQLSGGQRQGIALARALLGEPPMIILDEPTNHLDDTSVSRLVNVLKELSYKPTILIISHNETVLEIADESYQIRKGKIKKLNNADRITYTTHKQKSL